MSARATTFSKRQFLHIGVGAALLHASLHQRWSHAAQPGPATDEPALRARLQALEHSVSGRLGVHVIDTGSGQEWGYRADERFMMLSSFKLLASALVLHRVDAGHESLERRIAFTRSDVIDWSPVTEAHAGGPGLTLAELCAATLTTSDNTAANLILASFGGPGAVTAYARQLGDRVTRLDRTEPTLNQPGADTDWDTTSPRAMAHTVQQLVLGDALSAASRQRLQKWLLANTTGGARLKAGLPPGWRIGEKTGTNRSAANDIGVIWPPHRAPLVVAAYLADTTASNPAKEAALAHVSRLVAASVGK